MLALYRAGAHFFLARNVDDGTQLFDVSHGRRLAYLQYGDPDGSAVFYHHGGPGSRLDAQIFGDLPGHCGIRLIAVDRPGIGRSDWCPGWTLLSFAEDVRRLADGLGLDRFGVLGISGGGPPALACAFLMAERLNAVVSVAGAPYGPLSHREMLADMALADRVVARVAWAAPWAMRLIHAPVAWYVRRFPRHFSKMIRTWMPPSLESPGGGPSVVEVFRETVREAFIQGGKGPARDAFLDLTPWGFDVEKIEARVTIWQGTADTLVSAQLQQRMAARMPAATLRLFPDEGHFLFVRRAAELMNLLRQPHADL